MTLRSSIQNLRVYAEVANDEHRVKVRTGHFAELSARLNTVLTELPGLKDGLAEVQQLNLVLPPNRDKEAAQLGESLRALAAQLLTVTIEQNLDLARVRVRSAEKYVRDLRTLVEGAWRVHLSQPRPAINNDLVDALAQGGVDVEDIRGELESARARLFAISSKLIPDRGDVEKYCATIAAIHNCGEDLGGVVDADIAEGIVKSQEDSGMPLSWFTPERLEKLVGLGIIDRFYVRLR